MSVGSKPLQGQAFKTLGTATTASTMHRLSEAPKRPLLQAQAELSGDASRVLAFLQMHSRFLCYSSSTDVFPDHCLLAQVTKHNTARLLFQVLPPASSLILRFPAHLPLIQHCINRACQNEIHFIAGTAGRSSFSVVLICERQPLLVQILMQEMQSMQQNLYHSSV